ncbi:hypothetical protein [Chitinibacter sp. S2-10]|uniref:hypothetical protein n=1 Tax=Chitinibacter sp. S2-10 TaxID=3373597 RepID=UPI003977B868
MKKALLALALVFPVATSMAATPSKKASQASAVSEINNPFTPERNQATGNLSMTIIIQQKMAMACKDKPDLNEEKIKASLKKWIDKNKIYLQTHADYMGGYFATVQQFEGEETAKKVQADMKKTFNEQSDSVIKTAFEKKGPEAACKQYFAAMNDGKMDIKTSHPDYKVLNGMVEYSKKAMAKTAKQ